MKTEQNCINFLSCRDKLQMLLQLCLLCVAVYVVPVHAGLYNLMSDGRCMRYGRQYLTYTKLVNELQCAVACDSVAYCSVFAAFRSNSSCMLYSGITMSSYSNLTYDAQGLCRLGLADNQQIFPAMTIQIIKNTTIVTVPGGANTLTGVCIGGGGGANYADYGGGGSGYISYGTVRVTPGIKINVTIGAGGVGGNPSGATSGGTSSIGSYIVASGGSMSNGANGGAGGSGGGCGAYNWGTSSCAGGSSGNSGNSITTSGGAGQGTSVWTTAASYLNTPNVTITFGSAGSGYGTSDTTVLPGGGGAGGIIVNGVGISAISGSAVIGHGLGGYGYGAGGGAGGCYSNSCTNSIGGAGAPGICIIKFTFV